MPILALRNPTFQPAMRVIASITQANPAVVTTTFDHNYLTGEVVRISIARGNGMTQIDKIIGNITVTGNTTFTFPIDSSAFDTYVVPPQQPGQFFTQSQVLPVGEVNELLRLATRNVLRTPR